MTADLLLSEENVRKLALTLLHFVWQGALLGALAWSVLYILTPRRAQTRYAIHCGLLLLLVAAPITTFVSLSAGAGTAVQESMQLSLSNSDPSSATNPPAAAAGTIADVRQGYGTTLFRAWLEQAQSWLVACWLVGSTTFGIRLVLGAVGVWRLMRSRQPLPAEVAAMVDRLIQAMAFQVRPAVYATEHVSQAIAIGVFKPMVLLPAAWVLELQPVMLEAVVAHELAHLRRWDLPINGLQRLVETLLFFHPVVWWCSRRLRIEREWCCDERATQATGDRAGYAKALTFLAERQVSLWEPLLAAGIGGSRMVLLERIRNVLGVSRRAHGRFYGLSCAVVGAAAASLVWLATLYVPSGGSKVEVATIQSPPAATARRMAWPTSKQSSSSADGESLPSENNMGTLPDYVIEPPDVLFIEAIHVVPKTPQRSMQPIAGEHLVAPDGTVNLGTYGRVQLAGMTLDEGRAAIERHLEATLDNPQVFLSVFAYNSKVYYVVTEGEGLGDTVARFPITGNETVLDALAQMNGLTQLQNKQIWIARPYAGGAGCDVILPVNWKEITAGAATASNYQVLPGDRIFISDSPPKMPAKSPTTASDAASVDGAGYDAAGHTADSAAQPIADLRFDREPGVVDLIYHLKEGARGGTAAASAR